eukprot:TRINITY_DN15277_c0_g1_i1.p1 TRINITY_DN15277_c0_g1~~TRINITY_DN15277_c0_g1_i1.p1  ORF type:complete len:611 (-),score=106.31 TRINITY_DN15277_c0_g1_i1:189-2021(-)
MAPSRAAQRGLLVVAVCCLLSAGSSSDVEAVEGSEGLEHPDVEVTLSEEVHGHQHNITVDIDEAHSMQSVHFWAGEVVLPTMVAAMVAIVLASLVHHCKACRVVNWIPESAVFMAVGMALGTVMKLCIDDFDAEVFGSVNSILLNLVLLPIIIFESGWDLRTKDFLSQFVYILVFALFGTIISTAVIAGLMMATGQPQLDIAEHGTYLRVCFCYASLISAVDPVASLATYSSLKVQPLLNIIVFGESTINDAVAIALFRAFNAESFWDDYESPQRLVWDVSKVVCKLLFGSMILGFLVSAASILVIRVSRLGHYPHSCIIFVMTSAFMTFSLAEGVAGLSGIISVLFGSMFMGIYARQHFTVAGGALATFYLKATAAIADMTVFILGGVVIAINFHWKVAGFYIMSFCVVARFASTYPLGVIVNLIKRMHAKRNGLEDKDAHYLSAGHLFTMCWAGLRGGIALALVLELGPWVPYASRELLQQITFYLVFVFLMVFGGTTQLVLTLCGIPMGEETSPDELWARSAEPLAANMLSWIDDRIMMPMLVGSKARSLKERDLRRRMTQDLELAGGTSPRDTDREKQVDVYDILQAAAFENLLAGVDSSSSGEES